MGRLCEEPDKEIQYSIAWLTSVAGTAGIHLILVYDFAGSRYLPAEIRANLPNTLVFRTTSSNNSRLAGVKNAEKLSPDEAILNGNFVEGQTRIRWHRLLEDDVRKFITEIKKE